MEINVRTVYIVHEKMLAGMDHHGKDQRSWIISSRRECMITIKRAIVHRLSTRLSYYSTEIAVGRMLGGILQTENQKNISSR